MKKNAFGAIDLLIGLAITAVIFLISVNALKGVSSLKLKDTAIDKQSVQQHVDETVNEIERMRKEALDYGMEIQNGNY
ncbi:unknown [Clostridium sp. CAG:967]|nr:unknown [Clostridium sp. CAG:967]